LQAQIFSRDFRTDTYQSFQNMQGEACMSDPTNQCLLDPEALLPQNNRSSTCKQGIVSPLYVEVRNEHDVNAVFEYAKKSKTTISIKNSGHDYVMRSSREGSLAIWTRGLRSMAFHKSFTPSGCTSKNSKPVPAITLGSGVTMGEAMAFAYKHKTIFVSGSSPSVGASGGWLLNGGHSPISNSLGLAIDRVLQFTVVTPDGKKRVANKCTNSDLFWALRGGGGGSFGVVLDSTHLAEPERPIMSAMLSLPPTADAKARRGFVEVLAANANDWALAGWGGPAATTLSAMVNPFITNVTAARASLAPAIKYVEGQANGTALINLFPTWFDYWAATINGTFLANETVSEGTLLTSKLVPETVFKNNKTRTQVIDGIMQLEAEGFYPAFLTVAPIRYARDHPKREDTSIHPGWYESTWLLAGQLQWKYDYSLQRRKDTVRALGKATSIISSVIPASSTDSKDGQASYANEADPWLSEWEREYWGRNYPRLMEIKRKYDPENLLNCWHCVGWNEKLKGYGCVSKLV